MSALLVPKCDKEVAEIVSRYRQWAENGLARGDLESCATILRRLMVNTLEPEKVRISKQFSGYYEVSIGNREAIVSVSKIYDSGSLYNGWWISDPDFVSNCCSDPVKTKREAVEIATEFLRNYYV